MDWVFATDRGQILRLHGDNSPVVVFKLKDNLSLPNSKGRGLHMQVNGGPVFLEHFRTFCLRRSRRKHLCRNSDTLYLFVYL